MYSKECKWCFNIIEVDNQPLFALHIANCKSNPNLGENRKKSSLKLKGILKSKRINLDKVCPKCELKFKIIATESEIKRNKVKKYCSLKCANSRSFSSETKNKISNSLKGKIPLNKGIKKVYESICLKCSKVIMSNNYKKNRKYHKECWLKISGGFKEGSVKNYRSGRYKGFWCDSSYELAFIIFCIDNKIEVRRNTEGFKYLFNNKEHLFYPDFIINDNLFIEVKNYKSIITESKIKHFPNDISVLYKEDMIPYINYCIKKYGKDYVKLYD